MRVFISHKREDEISARAVAAELDRCRIEYFLDVMDPVLKQGGVDVTAYLRKQLEGSTHLIAVISNATKESWWVPFEIGIATDREYPLATCLMQNCVIPEYLHKWPILRSSGDVTKYVRVARTVNPTILNEGLNAVSSTRRAQYTKDFYVSLRRELGQ